MVAFGCPRCFSLSVESKNAEVERKWYVHPIFVLTYNSGVTDRSSTNCGKYYSHQITPPVGAKSGSQSPSNTLVQDHSKRSSGESRALAAGPDDKETTSGPPEGIPMLRSPMLKNPRTTILVGLYELFIALRAPRIPIVKYPPGFTYQIRFRQHPGNTLACIERKKENCLRTLIRPVPIVEMIILDENLSSSSFTTMASERFLLAVVYCSLLDGNLERNRDVTDIRNTRHRLLMGNHVNNHFEGVDENSNEGSFVCSPDMSVAEAGVYRLRAVLVVLDQMKMDRERFLSNQLP